MLVTVDPQSKNKSQNILKFRSKPDQIWHVMKKNTKRSNRAFNLSKEDFLKWYEQQKKVCFYCGIDEENHRRILNRRLEIDRVSNNISYELDNMVICCRYCNGVKGNILDKQDMIFIGNNVIKQKWIKSGFT